MFYFKHCRKRWVLILGLADSFINILLQLQKVSPKQLIDNKFLKHEITKSNHKNSKKDKQLDKKTPEYMD